MKVFVTGDRQATPESGFVFAAASYGQGLVQTGGDLQVYTGTNEGFEAGVRQFLERAGLPVLTVPQENNFATGKPDWDKRHTLVNEVCDYVVFIHADPLSSSIGASLGRVVPDEKFIMPVVVA